MNFSNSRRCSRRAALSGASPLLYVLAGAVFCAAVAVVAIFVVRFKRKRGKSAVDGESSQPQDKRGGDVYDSYDSYDGFDN